MDNLMPLPPHDPNRDRTGYPYPFQIGLRAQRLVHGILVYYLSMNTAAHLYMESNKNSLFILKEQFINAGLAESVWEVGLQYMDEFTQIYQNPLLLNVILSMAFNWDWYISNLGQYILFSNQNANTNPLTNKQQKDLAHLHRIPLAKVLPLLTAVLGLDLKVKNSTIRSVDCLLSARHIGVHKNWVVDQNYIDSVQSTDLKPGQILPITTGQLIEWWQSLNELIGKTCIATAIVFDETPKQTHSA